MTNWPTASLIYVNRARTRSGAEIENDYALRDPDGDYRVADRWLMCHEGDSIDAWEEVTAVPTAHLEELKAAWKGFGMYDPDDSQRVTDAITTILSYLPANKLSALDRAVTRVKDAVGRMIDAEFTQEERLSLLLDALASVQSATRKTAPLTMVARICADWANLENPRRDSLEDARERTKVLSDPGSFIVLSVLVGDVTTALCDNFSPRHDLIDVAAYALAWAAQTIEEEEDR